MDDRLLNLIYAIITGTMSHTILEHRIWDDYGNALTLYRLYMFLSGAETKY